MTKELYRFCINAESDFDLIENMFIYSDTEDNAWNQFNQRFGHIKFKRKSIKKVTKNLKA